MIKVGSQFSGVGAFEQSLIRLGIDFKNIYAADWDKYARQTYLLNFEEPEYYVKDVHDTPIKEITEKHGSLDIAMFSPPCQAFSLAGKRLGKEDQRGILFFNSLEFIKENKPRYFIFENVKGLLSHDKQDKNAEYGRTFQEWINYLGGKSVNGVHTFFPIEDSVPYHIYFQVLNAKHYGIPQNRERIFIIGIRDDEDNNFSFPKPFPLEKKLKDILETEVDEKYFLSDKMIDGLINTDHLNSNRINNAIRVGGQGSLTKKHSFDVVKVGHINQDTQASQVFSEDGTSPSICAGTHGYALGYVETQIGTWRTHEDGRGFRATEDNNCPTIPARAREDGSGQPVIKVNEPSILGYTRDAKGKVISRHEKDISGTIHTASGGGGNTDQFVKIGAIRGRNPENPKSRQSGLETEQMLEINENGTSNTLTTVQKDNVVVISEILKSIDNEKRNTAKVLLMLQQEIGKKAIETWRLRILEIIREKTLLQQRLHEESVHSKKQKGTRGYINKIQQTESFKIDSYVIMRSLPKEEWERCSSQRRKSIKQLVRQLNESLQKLSYENPQTNSDLQSGELQYENKGVRILRETLSKIQEIQQPFNKQIQGQRIRRLTPTEAFRLMDFNESFYKTINFNNIANSKGILLSLQNKTDIKWNVKESDVKEKQKLKECVCFTIKEITNTEMKILSLNTHTEKIQNVQLKIAMEMFTAKDIVQNTTILTENGAILYLAKNNNQKSQNKQGKELLILEEKTGLEEKENHYTDYYLRLSLDESLQGTNTSIILTTIQTITNYLTYIYSIPKENTITVILNYKNCQKNFLKGELLNLKMGNTILSDSQLYKQAGNSICVGVLAAIISKLKL